MMRILEEKNRQRTVSTGSLDGMVITRENEVIALSSSEAYESVAAAAAAYAATHPVDDYAHPLPPTSCTEKRTDEPSENRVRCIHTAGFSKRSTLQPLQEEPFTPVYSNQHSCTAVLPPPVRFNRYAVRRIAKAIIHKLQTAKVLPRNSSFVNDTSRSCFVMSNFRLSDVGGVGPRSYSKSSQNQFSMNYLDDKLDELLEDKGQLPRNPGFGRKASPNFPPTSITSAISRRPVNDPLLENVSSPRLSAVNSSHMVSRPASSVILDPCINGLIIRELHGLPLDDQTKASILTALRFELKRSNRRADLFLREFRKLGRENSTRLPTETVNPCEPGRDLFHVTYKGGFGSIQRTACLSPSYTEPSNNRSSEALSHTVFRWEAASHISGVAGIQFEPHDKMASILGYIVDMLDVNILKNVTFLVLLLACSINMLVLLVPYYYLPLLLEVGGFECSVNKQWCPNGLPHYSKLRPNWLHHLTRWIAGDDSATYFVNPGSVLLTIGFTNVAGRILSALYMERNEKAQYKRFKQCSVVENPFLLNVLSFLLCGLSMACFPLCIHGVVTSTLLEEHKDPDHPESVQAWSTEFRLFLLYLSSITYGVASAIALSLRSVILVELFGIRRLTNAFGYLLILQGLAVICGPPLFGCFCDLACRGHLPSDSHSEVPSDVKSSHSFACTRRLCTAFYICAALFLLTGLLFLPLRRLSRRESCCCPSASCAVPPFYSPKEPCWGEIASSSFPPPNPDFIACNNQETQTTVLQSCTDSDD